MEYDILEFIFKSMDLLNASTTVKSTCAFKEPS